VPKDIEARSLIAKNARYRRNSLRRRNIQKHHHKKASRKRNSSLNQSSGVTNPNSFKAASLYMLVECEYVDESRRRTRSMKVNGARH
jgi:hypothetical protein